jgi:hypothetical protein
VRGIPPGCLLLRTYLQEPLVALDLGFKRLALFEPLLLPAQLSLELGSELLVSLDQRALSLLGVCALLLPVLNLLAQPRQLFARYELLAGLVDSLHRGPL